MDIQEFISSGNIEMYVMGLASAEEKAEMEDLRTKYPALEKAILQFEKEFENNMRANSLTTTAKVDAIILNSFNEKTAPVVQMPVSKTPAKRLNWLKPMAAASVFLLAVSIFYNYNFYKKNKAQQAALQEQAGQITLPGEDYNILKQPSITPVAMYGVAPHNICRCTMFWDKKTGRAYIMIHHLVPSSPANNYQLWAMVDGKPVSAGLVNDKIRDRFIAMENLPANATSFIVTLEKAGGSTAPTLDETYLSGKI